MQFNLKVIRVYHVDCPLMASKAHTVLQLVPNVVFGLKTLRIRVL
jgi:hypothetical protein